MFLLVKEIDSYVPMTYDPGSQLVGRSPKVGRGPFHNGTQAAGKKKKGANV